MGRKSNAKKDPSRRTKVLERREVRLAEGDMVRTERARQAALGNVLGANVSFRKLSDEELKERERQEEEEELLRGLAEDRLKRSTENDQE